MPISVSAGANAFFNANAVAITGGSINGTNIGNITPAQGNFSGVGLAAGTAAAPAIDFRVNSDADTGIFSPAVDQIGFSTAGAQRALITSTGLNNTAIGATTAAAGTFTTITGTSTAHSLGTANTKTRLTIAGTDTGTAGGSEGVWFRHNAALGHAVATFSAVVGGTLDLSQCLYAPNGWKFHNGGSSIMTLDTGSNLRIPAIPTTASAANCFLDSADGNAMKRSTSSVRYKTNIEDLWTEEYKTILKLRPVYYKSLAESDPANFGYHGFIAEEVAEVQPRLVHYAYAPEAYEEKTTTYVDPETGEERSNTVRVLKDSAEKVPDGVQYDRVVVGLVALVKDLYKRIEALEAKNA